jgi:hypothetical protein
MFISTGIVQSLPREFLANEDVAKLLASHAPNWDNAVTAVIDASTKKWRQEEEVIDDITWYAFFFLLPSMNPINYQPG